MFRRLVRGLGRLDAGLAAVEAFLVCLLIAGLAAGGLALVLLQNVDQETRPGMFLSIRILGTALAVLGAGLAVAGLGGRGRRKAHGSWGLKILGLAAFVFLVWGATFLEANVEYLQRAAVLWLGMFGAALATRQRKHITIEILERFLGPRSRRAATALVALAACGFLGLLTYVAGRYAFDPAPLSRNEAYVTFYDSDFVVYAWWIKAILPIGLGIMTWRMLLLFLESIAGPEAGFLETPLPEIEHVHDEASWAEESQG